MSDGDAGEVFRVNCFHHAASIERAAKNFETAFAKNFAEIDKLHLKTAVRFIAAIAINCLAISESVKRRFDLAVARRFEDRGEHSFGNRENVLWSNERCLDVNLSKLRLPISP